MPSNVDIFVSIIMISYNHKQFVKQAIDGVLNQTHSNFEFIIIDDGSTDGSDLLLQTIAETDNRIRLFFQKNSGPSVALNFAIRQAQGEYIATTASDDIFYPSKIEKQLGIFLKNNQLSAIVTHVDFIDETSQIIDTPKQFHSVFNVNTLCRSTRLLEFLVHGNCLNASSAMFPAKLFEKTGFFHPASMQLQDFDFYFRCLDFGDIEIISEKLMAYRVHSKGENLSSPLNGLRSANEEYFILPNLLNSIYRNCSREHLIHYIKERNLDNSDLTLENTSKAMLVYLLCRIFTENQILQVVAVQFFATRLSKESEWNVQDAQELFKDLAKRDIGGHCINRTLCKIVETQKKELEAIKKSYTFIIGRRILWLPKLILRKFFGRNLSLFQR